MSTIALAIALLLAGQPTSPHWSASIPVDRYPSASRTQIATARDVVLAAPTKASAAGEFALVLHAWEQFDAAAHAYADARRLAPRDATWWALSGRLASRMGRHDLAAEYYATAVKLAPTPLLSLRLGDALLEHGDLEPARAAYSWALADRDAEPSARYGLGRIALASGALEAARTEFERAIALDGSFGAAHYALAQVQRRQGDLAGARTSLARQQACLACWPIPPDPLQARLDAVRDDAAALLQRGLQSVRASDDAKAIEQHVAALERNPELLQARVNLIALYARTGNLAQAETQYRAVVEAGTQLAEAHRAWGLGLLGQRDAARAEPVLRLAVDANPHDADAHNALGVIHETSNRLADAEQAYARAVVAAPASRDYRFNHARALAKLGRSAEALAELLPLGTPDDGASVRYVFAASAVAVRMGDATRGRQLAEEALARARRHGLPDVAATIERELAKLK